ARSWKWPMAGQSQPLSPNPDRCSGRVFEEVRDRVTTWGQSLQLQDGARIAPMIGSVQADVQDDLASPHARGLSAGEDEVDRLLEIGRRQPAHVGRVPPGDVSATVKRRRVD